jgi:transposase
VGKTSNRYDDEFKAHAVSMVVEKGRPIRAVAKVLGVSEPAIRRWVKLSAEPEDSAIKRIAELEAQNQRLKQELADAKDTVKVLNKSVAIFTRP